MNPSDDLTLSNSLADLAARIRAEHEACDAALKHGLQHAIAAGQLLIEAKALLKHGQWLPWLREHCGIPERTARRYMQVAPYYAADDIGQNGRFELPQILFPPPTAVSSYNEAMAWARQRLDGPFTLEDFQQGVPTDKILLHAGVPPLVAVALTRSECDRLPLLRLCSSDDLGTALCALGPVADSRRALQCDFDSMSQLLACYSVIRLMTECLLGALLVEIGRRDKCDYSEQQYQREWDETHAAWMASLEASMAALGVPDQTRPVS